MLPFTILETTSWNFTIFIVRPSSFMHYVYDCPHSLAYDASRDRRMGVFTRSSIDVSMTTAPVGRANVGPRALITISRCYRGVRGHKEKTRRGQLTNRGYCATRRGWESLQHTSWLYNCVRAGRGKATEIEWGTVIDSRAQKSAPAERERSLTSFRRASRHILSGRLIAFIIWRILGRACGGGRGRWNFFFIWDSDGRIIWFSFCSAFSSYCIRLFLLKLYGSIVLIRYMSNSKSCIYLWSLYVSGRKNFNLLIYTLL